MRTGEAIYEAVPHAAGRVNIAVLHGQIGTVGGEDAVNLNLLKNKGIDYLALGHIHSYRRPLHGGQNFVHRPPPNPLSIQQISGDNDRPDAVGRGIIRQAKKGIDDLSVPHGRLGSGHMGQHRGIQVDIRTMDQFHACLLFCRKNSGVFAFSSIIPDFHGKSMVFSNSSWVPCWITVPL